ncbi:hypothetical protein VPMS16_2505 [Vibrio sp. 16]|nr:hypothetical protein VPMS16_2505 [Vibrio sp. 16]
MFFLWLIAQKELFSVGVDRLLKMFNEKCELKYAQKSSFHKIVTSSSINND